MNFLALVNTMVEKGLLKEANRNLLLISDNINDLLDSNDKL
jgi:hypothetical protein